MESFAYAPTFSELPPPLPHAHTPEEVGCVVRLDRGLPAVLGPSGIERAEHSVEFVAASEDARPTLGDWVHYETQGTHDSARIRSLLPRKNALRRYKRASGENVSVQVLAANLDAVMFVQPLVRAEYIYANIARAYVIAAEAGLTQTFCVVFSKCDLASCALIDEVLANCRACFGQISLVCTDHAERGLEAIRKRLQPHTHTVLLGESGVGKSTLVNRLLGVSVMPTQEVSKKLARGRHTTVCRRMVSIPHAGIITDIPGIQHFSIAKLTRGFSQVFDDIEQLARRCKFSNCEHLHEHGCAVIEAQQNGDIFSERLALYRELRSEL